MDKNMSSCLKGMADIISRRWEEELEETEDAQYALIYAQLASAIAAFNAPKPFIQIGRHIINRADIIRVEIKKANSYYNEPEHVRIYTRDVYGAESYGSTSNYEKFPLDSPEAKAILAWLKDHTEVIVPLESDGEEVSE